MDNIAAAVWHHLKHNRSVLILKVFKMKKFKQNHKPVIKRLHNSHTQQTTNEKNNLIIPKKIIK